jgi:hypothetical protein
MTENEFEVMDHLYFVVSFQELLELTSLEKTILSGILWGLIDQGMANCFINPEEEIKVSKITFNENFTEYYYLASKSGLLEHNMR